MRNTLAFVGAAVVAFLGLGYYLGWYNIVREPSASGHSRLQVDIDRDKIGKDVKKGVEDGGEQIKELLDKNAPEKPAAPTIKPLPPTGTGSQDAKSQSKRPSTEEAFKDLLPLDDLLAPRNGK